MGRNKRASGSNKKKKGKKKGNKAPQQQQQQQDKETQLEEDTSSNKNHAITSTDDDDTEEASPSTSNQSHSSSTSNSMPRLDPNRPRSQLEMLPPHLLFRIVSGLNQREKDILFHVVTGNELAPENDENEDDIEPQNHRWRVPYEFVAADPDTLLARLNTRRLYKRLQDNKKQTKDDNSINNNNTYIYPSDMTTDDIALLEWNKILERATKQGRVPNNQLPPLISPSRELLMFTPCPRSVAVLASFPRSGNSLLRTLYEKITLRVSGSDMRGGLVGHDLVGEAAVSSNRVQFVKTHYPERRGIKEYQASRVVLLVRNPYDALESYFNLMTTGTHTTTLNDEMREQLDSVWENMVKKEIQVWQAFHEYWLSQDIPLLLVRYEDLIRYPYDVMCRVIQFVLEINNMDFFKTRIARCVEEEAIEQLGSYQPRSGGIGKSLSKYSPQMLQDLNFGIFDTMEQLDYTSLLIPSKEKWNELEPLPDYAREYHNNPDNTVTINEEGKPLVRTPKHRTNWAKLKREMKELSGGTCQCAKCIGRGR